MTITHFLCIMYELLMIERARARFAQLPMLIRAINCMISAVAR